VGCTHKTNDYWQHLQKMEVLELFNPKSFNASKHVRDEKISSLMHDVFGDCKVMFYIFFKVVIY
jgi:hypothetical protein